MNHTRYQLDLHVIIRKVIKVSNLIFAATFNKMIWFKVLPNNSIKNAKPKVPAGLGTTTLKFLGSEAKVVKRVKVHRSYKVRSLAGSSEANQVALTAA